MATLTLLPDTGHHQQQQSPHGHHHAKQKCTSATCCSPSRIWRSIQQLIGDNNKQDLIKLCQDPNRASHVLRVLLSSRLTNDASLYPASNKHRVIQLVDRDGASGLSPRHYRAMVNTTFGKTATDLNALQLALFHGNEGIACYLLQLVRQHAGDKDMALFVNHLWGARNGSLHLACFLGMPRVVQLLLEMGVSPDAVNGKLKTPLDCCGGVDVNGDGGQPSVLDCRTLIEHALLIKYGKKLSVDASSPSPSLGVGIVTTASEQKSGDNNVAAVSPLMDDDNDNDCAEVISNMDNGDINLSFGSDSQDASAKMSPLSGGKDDDPDIQVWSLPLLLMDSPFDSDPFASSDGDQVEEEWSPPLLLLDNPFDSGDPFISDDDDEEWSPHLLLKDDLFASDDSFALVDDGESWTLPMLLTDNPFVSDDDDDNDDDGLVPGVMDSHGKCSVSNNFQLGGGVSSMIGGYYDDNPSGIGKSNLHPSLIDSDGGELGDTSVIYPPVMPTGRFGMKDAPDPKSQDYSHQGLHPDPRAVTGATRLRGRIRNPDPTIAEHGMDTSWPHPQQSGAGTGHSRAASLLYSFVKQFKANLKSNDWKAPRHESPSSERKNPTYDMMNMLTGVVSDGMDDQDNPNTEQLLLMIARALHTSTPPPSSITQLYQCNFTGQINNNPLESRGIVHHSPPPSSLLVLVGGNT